MNDLSKKGLYTLVYTPKKSMNENCYYTHVKIGRTGISFKKRFQGYKGSNKVTNDVTVHLVPLHVPDGCSESYGFEEEEKILKQKIQGFVDCNPTLVKTKTSMSEHYFVKSDRSHKFIKIILDGIESIKKVNSKYAKVKSKCQENVKQASLLSSLWKYAWKAVETENSYSYEQPDRLVSHKNRVSSGVQLN